MAITKDDFFKPGRATEQNKAPTPDQVVRQIVSAETAQRMDKTERLRQLREAQEAAGATRPPVRGK